MQIAILVSIVGAGFSVISAGILLCAYLFSLPTIEKSSLSRLACALVLLGIAALQVLHLQALVWQVDILATRIYVSLLASLPLAFYLFSRFVLFPNEQKRWTLLFHVLPPAICFGLPVSLVPAVAFAVGAAYTLWLVTRLVRLRADRHQFGLEVFFFAMFAIMAVVALILGLLLPNLNHQFFYLIYPSCIALAMTSVVALVIIYPELLPSVVAITDAAYSDTKLAGIDVEKKLGELRRLMHGDRLYENASLSLSKVAEALNLSSHQLSELLNRHDGNNFPGFVRRYRIEAAKDLLRNEPQSSVLAISVQTGFKSQSAFYSAFKTATGMSPGAYRQP